MKVGIVGFGWVGKSMYELFPNAVVYDPLLVGQTIDEDRYENSLQRITDDKKQLNDCDIVFICVPTPNRQLGAVFPLANGEGALDTSIVEDVVSWCEASILVIRSTVNPGDSYYWQEKYGRNIVVQPEYLGETPAHPLLNPKNRPFVILGGYQTLTRKVIELYSTVYNAEISIRQVTQLEAEIIKLTENRAIAFKVAQCQELYDVCERAGVDYYTIIEAVYSDDPRFNKFWTFIYPGKRGMNSKCIPKDVYAWCAFAESLGYQPKITRALLEKNKEWIS